MTYDLIIRNGRWFDGLGSPSAVRDIGVRQGRVAAISERLSASGAASVIDAQGKWVLPGFIDIHTHYDAEVLLSPGLPESVRHGVTTVLLGSCSLSTVHAEPLDCADLFSRVEAVPHEHVLCALERRKTWSTAADYVRFLETLPLGPNVALFLGHSDLRTSVMGLGRATDVHVRPSPEELGRMESLLDAALAVGFVGLSTMMSKFDKLAGDRYRSRSLPSTFARWSEYRRLHRVLRRRGRVLQSAPNPKSPLTGLLFFLSSMGGFFRSPLKTSLLTCADAKSMTWFARAITGVARWFNRLANSNVRWQHLPVPFELYADGIDLPVFEELGAGAAALHLKDELERNRLLRHESFRRQFRQDTVRRFGLSLWNRDFHDAFVVTCPDTSVVGQSFGQVAASRGIQPADAFLDLVVEHGSRLRWRTVVANHRPEVLDRLASDESVQIGFADSGAHLRNMAFYNSSVRLLKRAHEAEQRGRPFITMERAVHRLTGELAAWFGLDAGTLREGDRADIVIVDPAGLDASLDEYREAPMSEIGGLSRMVNRSDRAVVATLIAGRPVFEHGTFAAGFGEQFRTGQFLSAGEP